MLKKTILAASIAIASMSAFSANAATSSVLTLGTDTTQNAVTEYNQVVTFKNKEPLTYSPVAYVSGQTPAGGTQLTKDQGFVGKLEVLLGAELFRSATVSDFTTVPEGMEITGVSTSTITGVTTIVASFELTSDIDIGSQFAINIDGLTNMVVNNSGTAAAPDYDPIAVESVKATFKTDTASPLANATQYDLIDTTSPIVLVNFVEPYSYTLTPSSGSVVLSQDSQGFSSTESATTASIGTVTISTYSDTTGVYVQDIDGQPRAFESTDDLVIELTPSNLKGLGSLKVGGVTETVTAALSYSFDVEVLDGPQVFDVSYIADTDANTDIKAQPGAAVDVDVNNIDVDLTGASTLSAITAYDLGQTYRLNAITNPTSSDKTIIRITNPSANNVILSLAMTNQDGTKLGSADLPNLAPYATVAYSSSDFAELVGEETWTGRANAVISSTSDSLKIVPLLRSNGVLTNQAGYVD